MNKVVKRKLIGSIFCIVVGIIAFVYTIIDLNITGLNEETLSYMRGFAGGLFGVGIVTLCVVIKAICDSNKAKELENIRKDERLNSINAKAMAISFRISVGFEAILSIIGACISNMKMAEFFGIIVCIQVVLYLVAYFIVKRNN